MLEGFTRAMHERGLAFCAKEGEVSMQPQALFTRIVGARVERNGLNATDDLSKIPFGSMYIQQMERRKPTSLVPPSWIGVPA